MGIFRADTEEEKLLKALKSADINYEFKKEAMSYVDGIIRGERKNDFFDTDFLVRVILEMVELSKECDVSFSKQLEDMKDQLILLFPNGEKTDNYEVLKERFINQYCGVDGYINLGITSSPNLPSFYALFPDDEHFFKMLRVIRETNKKSDKKINASDIFSYGIKVRPYCTSFEEMNGEVLSFMNDIINNVIDVQLKEYMDQRLQLMQEKCGIYTSINESSLALISAEVQKLEGYVLKLRNLERRIESYDRRISDITDSGVANIKSATEAAKEELAVVPDVVIKQVREEAERLNKSLDDYLLELEERLKTSSDAVFSELLNSASDKIRELKTTIQLMTTTTDSDLMRLQKQTQDSLDKLIKMAESNPKLQLALDTVSKHQEMQKGLQVLASMQGKVDSIQEDSDALATDTMSVPAGAKVVIPAADRLVVPIDPTIIIPENPKGLIPAFDYHVPLNERKKVIMDAMAKRESNGELFHEKSEEIIDCMLEGDWPYLWGPSGCGKTHTVEQIASLLGTEIVENGRITDDYTILGYYDPQGKFRATATYVALAYGKILFLDEMDTGVPETQTIFNPIYSKLIQTIEHPDRKYYVNFASDRQTLINSNFRMISTGNTKGSGENSQYNARLKIDESVQQRMTQIEFKYDNRLENVIFKDYEGWYNFFVNFRKVCDEYAEKHGLAVAPGITTTRDASAIVRYLEHDSKDAETILRQKFIQTKNDTYLNFLKQRFYSIYNLENEDTFTTPEELASKLSEKVLAKKFITCCSKAIKG